MNSFPIKINAPPIPLTSANRSALHQINDKASFAATQKFCPFNAIFKQSKKINENHVSLKKISMLC